MGMGDNIIMTQSKHTPAPWDVETVNSEDYVAYALLGCQYVSEQEANAHLIAAAPELLEALKRLDNTIDDYLNGMEDTPIEDIIDAQEQARLVIKKAESKTI